MTHCFAHARFTAASMMSTSYTKVIFQVDGNDEIAGGLELDGTETGQQATATINLNLQAGQQVDLCYICCTWCDSLLEVMSSSVRALGSQTW